MTYIWDQKPHYVWVPRGYYSKVRIKDDDIQMFILEETDPWLEKVKFLYEALTATTIEQNNQLEAIKKWYQNQLGLTETADHKIIELGKILEDQASSQEATKR